MGVILVIVLGLLVGLPLMSSKYLMKSKKEMRCFFTDDQDCFRQVQLDFSRAGIPGSLMTWSKSKNKEIWIPKAYSKLALEIVENQYEYHLTEFAVVIDRRKV